MVDAYDELADAAESAELAHPHEYALLYGSPVPGYQAPQDTVGPASRPQRVFAQIVHDAASTTRSNAAADDPMAASLRADTDGVA
ncbi:TetR-like C-terminal domain-containing protein [Dermatophilaceae bacterium Sec6.4]